MPRFAVPAFLACLALAPAARGEVMGNTFLLGFGMGNARSALADRLADGAYELSDGTVVRFHNWYGADWRDLEVSFLTELGEGFGLIWGISTGERGPKYRIAPALRLGFIAQWPVGRRGTLTLSGETLIGGDLTELPCVADYGAIGGVQAVNCRLAASELSPEETLAALVRADGSGEARLAAVLAFRF
ncbi:MAG: hypothetical protein ACKVPY_09090 [Paracoccaceae bacterium]